MLKNYAEYGHVYAEITRGAEDRGGPGWDFGTCLWIPSRNAAGADRYGLIRQVAPGNLVLHITARAWGRTAAVRSRLCGASLVASPVREVIDEPPRAGTWGGRPPYYRVELSEYMAFDPALDINSFSGHNLAEIRHDLLEHRPRFYPFSTYGSSLRLVQGIYLARCTPRLYELFRESLTPDV